MIGRLARAFDAVVAGRIRRWWSSGVERVAPKLAERLYRNAGRAANLPFRSEVIDLPPGGTVDVVDDLVAFTGLSRDVVEGELRTRAGLSFRAEWHATPEPMRSDHWFYLSAKGYLFANATHFPDSGFVDEFVGPHVATGARVLDFGGGTGSLALELVSAGYAVSVSELNALQRDFIRFRVDRHGLSDRLTVLDWWDQIPAGGFAAVVAVDVLEHLADARDVIGERLLPALAADGVLIENSPFVVNVANPMHHEDYGFEDHMAAEGFRVRAESDDGTRVWERK